jgi:hypothetical protein
MDSSHCFVSYFLPALEGFVGVELQSPLSVTGPFAGGSCDTERVRINFFRRRRPCGRCVTSVMFIAAGRYGGRD